MANSEVLYSVTWRDKPYGPAHVLDGYDEAEMHRIAIDLAEMGKDVDPLVGPIMVDMTPEDLAAMENVKAKLWARIASDRAIQMVQERLARKVECTTCHTLFESEPTKEMVR